MSKKRKRQIRTEAAPQRPVGPTFTGGARPMREDFNPDYTYVIKDLRRIGALAGSFLLILIVLSFFLR
jgi:hypothetical protein